MKIINSLSINAVSPTNCFLIENDQQVGQLLDGIILEKQFKLDDGRYLVMLTENVPYNDALHIYLLNQELWPIDGITAAADFDTGILDIKEIKENELVFTFYKNDKTYGLNVAAAANFAIFLSSGWSYKSFFSRHYLSLSER